LTLSCLNANGLTAKLEALENYLEKPKKNEKTTKSKKNTDGHLLFVSETWMNPATLYPYQSLIVNSPFPKRSAEIGHHHYGVAFLSMCPNIRSQVVVDHVVDGLCICLRVGDLKIIGLYLPPSLTTGEVECLLLNLPLSYRSGPRRVLMGDLNMRLGHITDDSATTRMALYKLVTRGRLIGSLG
jgi:hypothetical protein